MKAPQVPLIGSPGKGIAVVNGGPSGSTEDAFFASREGRKDGWRDGFDATSCIIEWDDAGRTEKEHTRLAGGCNRGVYRR
jgi:hypothetical protein